MVFQWTKTKPKRSGWYWVTDKPASDMVLIIRFMLEDNRIYGCYGPSVKELLEEDEDVYFAGPIPEPKSIK